MTDELKKETEVKPMTAELANEIRLFLVQQLPRFPREEEKTPAGKALDAIGEGRHRVYDKATHEAVERSELERLRADARLAIALDAFEHETRQLPWGHECPSKGGSTYNWRMDAVRRIRGLMAEVAFNISAKERAAIDAAQQEGNNEN